MARAAAQKRRAVDDDEGSEQTDYDSNDSAGGARTSKRKKTTEKRATAKSQSKDKGKNAKAKGKGKGKGKKRADSDSEDDDSDDDDSDDSDSDGDGQAGKGKKGELTEEEKKFYIQGMVRWILFNESHRRVLRRQDIVKAVLTDGRGRHFTSLLPKVQKILREVLGLDLVALRQKESATGKAQPKAYVVRSIVPLPLLRHLQTHRYPDLSFATGGADQEVQDQGGSSHSSKKKSLRRVLSEWNADGDDDSGKEAGAVLRDIKREEGALYGILGVVLALILVNGKVLGDDQLVSYLKRLSLLPSTPLPLSLASPHPGSITLSSFLSHLIKQQYLERGSSAHVLGATQAQGAAAKSQARTQTQRATQKKNKDAGAGAAAEAGDPAIEWRWGPRSEVEFGEMGVAKFVHEVFTDPASLPRSGGAETQTQTQTQGGGERFLAEVARAAGVKKLAGTGGGTKGGGAAEEDEGGEESE